MVERNIANAPRRGPGRPPKIASAPQGQAVPATSSPASIPSFMDSASIPSMMEKQIAPQDSAPEPSIPQRRRERKPFGSQSQKLARPKRPGYERHWFNDTPGRLIRAQEAGWDFVNKGAGPENGWNGTGERDTQPVGVNDSGSALMAYLMEIPEEWYKEDMAAEQTRIDEMERALRRGSDDQGEPGTAGRYIPSRGIKIEHGSGAQ